MVVARRRARAGLLSALILVAPILAGVSVPPRSATPRAASDFQGVESARDAAQVYIVQMAQAPVIAYDGGEPGIAPTRPGRGQHVNPNSASVRRYVQFLQQQHAAALAAAGVPAAAKFYNYEFSFNGFAAELTPGQDVTVEVTHADGSQSAFTAKCRIDTANEMEYYRNGGILHYVLRKLAA